MKTASEILLNGCSELRRLGFPFDEVAIICPTEASLNHLVGKAVDNGLDNFNNDIDVVKNIETGQSYHVRYEFLRFPGDLGRRIEAMTVLEGESVIHTAERFRQGFHLIHFSYKTENLEEYEVSKTVWGRGIGRQVAEFQSTYGRFSYFENPIHRNDGPYIKPRVNLRD